MCLFRDPHLSLICFYVRYSTTVAIAGTDFCIVASDTRQSVGYSINSRYAPKAFKM